MLFILQVLSELTLPLLTGTETTLHRGGY